MLVRKDKDVKEMLVRKGIDIKINLSKKGYRCNLSAGIQV